MRIMAHLKLFFLGRIQGYISDTSTNNNQNMNLVYPHTSTHEKCLIKDANQCRNQMTDLRVMIARFSLANQFGWLVSIRWMLIVLV